MQAEHEDWQELYDEFKKCKQEFKKKNPHEYYHKPVMTIWEKRYKSRFGQTHLWWPYAV